MNILFITQLFPANDEAIRYTSSALREFVTCWGNSGHQVQVIRPHFSYEKEPFPQEATFKIGANVDVEFIRPVRIPLLKLNYYSNNRVLNKLRFKPNVVICHLYNSYFTFHRLAQTLGVPLVIGIHMSDIKISHNRFHHWHQQRIYAKASAFACRSLGYQRLFNKQFPGYESKTFVALSGLPDHFFSETHKRAQHRELKVITVSWLIKRKQVAQVLKALALLPTAIEWTYSVIGTGEEEQRLRAICGELGLQTKVSFLGQLSRAEVLAELQQADLFVLPSVNETLGLVYLEAMASGCIAIGSKGEGIDGLIVDGENGFLCDPSSVDSIAEKIKLVAEMDEGHRNEIRVKATETLAEFTIGKKSEEYLEHVKKAIS